MDKVFFKIVIPNYNGMAYIPQCLDSIFGQTFQDFRVVFVDDMSTDFSYELAKAYERKYPGKMTAIRLNEKGHEGGARNAGIAYDGFSCEYVYFVDSDDYLFTSDSLRIIYDALGDRPDVLLFNMVQFVNGRYVPITPEHARFDESSKNLFISKWNSASAKAVKFDVIEPFLENCDHGADAYQFVKLIDRASSVKQIDDVIYAYRRHSGSLTCSTDSTRYADDTFLFYSKLCSLLFSLKKQNVRDAVNYRISLFNKGVIRR